MRKMTITSTLAAVALQVLVLLDAPAQGTMYLSNLGQPSSSSLTVSSDSWYAEEFSAGTNATSYVLNSIQLVMSPAFGNPSAFTVTLHTNVSPFTGNPGGSIGQLVGTSDPSAGGIYTYTPSATITLSRRGLYYIVVTAGTPVATGAYAWSTASTFSYASPDGWLAGPTFHSGNGSSWVGVPDSFPSVIPGIFPLFAIDATVIPEPSATALASVVATALLITCRRDRRHAQLLSNVLRLV